MFFAVTGGGNKTNLAVRITCDTGYTTVVTVPLDSNGAGTTATVFPPPGSICTGVLEDPQAIGRSKILGSLSFTIPA